jgi:Peptidase A4 family
VSWNGIDGFDNGDVLQGGSLSGAYCTVSLQDTTYCAWVEWFPSYDILCEFDVNPGDDIYVATWNTGPTSGYVFVEDLTSGVYRSVNLQPTRLPYLVGDTAEYIVERPADGSGSLYPLANYVLDFWAANTAHNFYGYNNGKPPFVPGSQIQPTYLITMINNQNTAISTVATAGKYGLVFSNLGCNGPAGCSAP